MLIMVEGKASAVCITYATNPKQVSPPIPTETTMTEYRTYITSNPNILFGKPTIKDTRIAVEQILDELAGGTTIDELLEAYPRLTREAIFAALAFAADTIRGEIQLP